MCVAVVWVRTPQRRVLSLCSTIRRHGISIEWPVRSTMASESCLDSMKSAPSAASDDRANLWVSASYTGERSTYLLGPKLRVAIGEKASHTVNDGCIARELVRREQDRLEVVLI